MINSIGLMSGTSMDGIDAALIETDGKHHVKSFAHVHLPYSSEAQLLFKALEYTVQEAQGCLSLAAKKFPEGLTAYCEKQLGLSSAQTRKLALNKYLKAELGHNEDELTLAKMIAYSTKLHAQAAQEVRKNAPNLLIECVGYHGQTVFHRPEQKKTVQIGSGDMLAATIKLTVVYDFRSHDVALGGRGAPFAPLYHQALAVRDRLYPIGVINCGGIANMTLILGEALDDILGFDTGPGNCLLDMYIRKITQGRKQMDENGEYALAGRPNKAILEALEQSRQKRYPQALDTHDFMLPDTLEQLSPQDACATLVQFTVESIIHALKQQQSPLPKRYILCGGGAYHPGIRQALTQRLKEIIHVETVVHTPVEIGWENQAIEAELMAYLAVRSLKNLPLSLPKTTGVPYPASGGKIAFPDKITQKFQE